MGKFQLELEFSPLKPIKTLTLACVRGESKYDFRTVSVQWTLRGGGGQVLDAKDCNCKFS